MKKYIWFLLAPLLFYSVASAVTYILPSQISTSSAPVGYVFQVGTSSVPVWVSTSGGGSGGGLSSTTPFSVGYIPFATTTNSLTNSNIFQLGQNIGIGTTTPQALFTVMNNLPFYVTTDGFVGIGVYPTTKFEVQSTIKFDDVDNVILGNGAGIGITSGSKNVLIGTSAGGALDIGANNILIGRTAGNKLTTGDYNFAMGSNALIGNITGSSSVAIGYGANSNDGNNSGNVTIGMTSGQLLQSGNYNTFIGFNSGDGLTTGDFNVFLGNFSGSGLSGTRNTIVIGSNFTLPDPSSNMLDIGNLIYATGLTEFSGPSTTVSSAGKVGIGTPTPAATLDVVGDAIFTSASTTSFFASGATTTDFSFTNATGTNANITNLTVGSCTGCGGAGAITTSSNASAGYFPYWFSGSALTGTSSIYQSGNSVGVGTTTPVGRFMVGSSTANPLFTVLDQGYVGIGTSTPPWALTVQGSNFNESSFLFLRTASGQDSFPLFDMARANNAVASDKLGSLQFIRVTSANGLAGIGARIQAQIDAETPTDTSLPTYLQFFTAASGQTLTNASVPRMVIDPNGKVGIATTTPLYTLTNMGSFYVSGTSTLSTTTISTLTVSATSSLTGNVGIGTSTPALPLTVIGSSSVSGALTLGQTSLTAAPTGTLWYDKATNALNFQSPGGQVQPLSNMFTLTSPGTVASATAYNSLISSSSASGVGTTTIAANGVATSTQLCFKMDGITANPQTSVGIQTESWSIFFGGKTHASTTLTLSTSTARHPWWFSDACITIRTTGAHGSSTIAGSFNFASSTSLTGGGGQFMLVQPLATTTVFDIDTTAGLVFDVQTRFSTSSNNQAYVATSTNAVLNFIP